MDTGVTHHLTSNVNQLQEEIPYTDCSFVMLGNGATIPITHSGDGVLSIESCDLNLHNLLCVLSLEKNLIFVRKFCQYNNVSLEFFPDSCFCEGP